MKPLNKYCLRHYLELLTYYGFVECPGGQVRQLKRPETFSAFAIKYAKRVANRFNKIYQLETVDA